MRPLARRPDVPRIVVAAWALATLLGGFTVAGAATRPAAQPRTLSPRTLAQYLAEVVPVPRDDVRVNGVYGSGHSGAWQFVAHVTWPRADGTIDGGVTNLPILAGNGPLDSPIDTSRFTSEHETGWTLDELHAVVARLDDMDDELALVELEVSASRNSVVACHSGRVELVGRCVEQDRRRRLIRRFDAQLTDNPFAQATAVQWR